jgi:hypothetical protein
MDESALRTLIASNEASRSALHWWLEFWTWWVVAGLPLDVGFVVWEYREDLHDFRRGIVHPPERPRILLFALGFLGAALVAVGVTGELSVEVKIERVETRIRKANDDLSTLLSKEAGDAATSAKKAHDEADAVTKEVAIIEERLRKASTQLARLDQRKDLLIKATPKLKRKLSPFAGQWAEIWLCSAGPEGGYEDDEIRDTVWTLNHILEKDARWNATVVAGRGMALLSLPPECAQHFAVSPFAPHIFGAGIRVLVSSKASRSTKNAANALGAALIAVLPFNPKEPEYIDPDSSVHHLNDPYPIEPNNRVIANANTIEIVVGKRPQPQ